MKNKVLFLLLLVLIITGIVINSCKKETPAANISALLTAGKWQLASVVVTNYIGTNPFPDTLNTNCDSTQVFTFNTSNTCTYTNFDCIPQPVAKGSWSLSSDGLYLFSDITCKDTITGGVPSTGKPFVYCQITTLGQYSMVLTTGDLTTYVTPTTKRKITVYGFVKQSQAVGN